MIDLIHFCSFTTQTKKSYEKRIEKLIAMVAIRPTVIFYMQIHMKMIRFLLLAKMRLSVSCLCHLPRVHSLEWTAHTKKKINKHTHEMKTKQIKYRNRILNSLFQISFAFFSLSLFLSFALSLGVGLGAQIRIKPKELIQSNRLYPFIKSGVAWKI